TIQTTHQPTDLPTHSGPPGATQLVIRNLTRTTGRPIGCMGLAEGELPSDDAIRITSVALRVRKCIVDSFGLGRICFLSPFSFVNKRYSSFRLG
uniref:Uncharacterized protein n=1 Tax=Anopheles minimus TaxID=112268 RepID=A0A182WPH9_9DIPT